MVTWNNLDTLDSFDQLSKVERVNLAEVMSGENGANRVKNYSVPMAEGFTYNYAAKAVDDNVLDALVKLAEEALKDIISPDEKKEVTPAFIISTVAEHFHVSVDDIRSNKRNTEIVVPRQIAMYLCSNLTSVGLKKIGSEMGGRDHSTVLHGSKKISSELKTSEDMRKTIEILKKKINPS